MKHERNGEGLTLCHGKKIILIAQPGAKSHHESVHSPHFRKEYSHLDTAVSCSVLFGRYFTESDLTCWMLILTEVEMELQDVSGPIKDLTIDRLGFHVQNG